MFTTLKRMLARVPVWGLAATATLALAGCGGGGGGSSTPPPPAVTLSSIAVTPATATVAIAGTQQLTVTGSYSDGSTKDLTGSSTFAASPSGVVSVSTGGLVTGVAAGTATITASSGGKSGMMSVTVPAPAVTLTSVAVTPATAMLAVAATEQLTVTGTYSDGSTKDLTNSSTFAASPSGVVSVSNSGLVTGVAAGTAMITATSGGKSGTASVTVPAPVTLTSITVSPSTASVNLGATQQLIVTGHYSDGSQATLPASGQSFVSSNSTAATVSAGGLVSVASFSSTPVTITVTNTATNHAATATITPSAPSKSGYVFLNSFAPGVSLVDSSSPAVSPTIDSTTTHNGHASLKIVIPATGASVALVNSTGQNLTGFNAVTFWAQASVAPAAGVGAVAIGARHSDQFNAEVSGFAVTTTWQQFWVPMPDPAQATSLTGLLRIGEGAEAYTLWISDVQYVTTTVTPTYAGVSLPVPPATLSLAGSPNSEPIGEASVPFSAPALPFGQETAVGMGWFTFSSSTPNVVTISTATGTGLITAAGLGTTNVQGILQGMPVPTAGAITVNP